jgi:predicted Zn-dependent peptidase
VTGIEIDAKEFFLENGMQFLIVERHTAPQVACRVAIRAGSALEEAGKTGIAHMLEHMMFKGTKNFGTTNVEKDQDLQARIEAAYQMILEERKKRQPNVELIEKKLAEMNSLRREVQKVFVPQAFSAQLGKNGAVRVNAFTTQDQTQYMMSIPSDMMEQWFSIVSEQLFEPSWREFYVEKEVVLREWAFRYVNNPEGAAWLDLNATAYTAHPYRNPIIGWKTDMERFSTKDAIDFHKTYYNPANSVCVLVGDITLKRAKKLAKIYFERYPSGKRAPEKVTEEPVQQGPRKSVRFLTGARTPLVRIGFHGTSMGTNDFYALDALTMILSHGRGARLNQNILEKGHAVEAWAYNPDNRYGGMIILGGSPNEPAAASNENIAEQDKRVAYLEACESLENLLLSEIERLKDEPVTARELERIKKLNQRDFLDRMRSNEDLAGTLATMEVQIGWRYLKNYLRSVSSVTPEDVQRVARKYLHTENKTSVYVIPGGTPDHPPETYSEIRSLSGSAAGKVITPVTFDNHSNYKTPPGWKHPLSFERKPEKIEYPDAETVQVENAKVFYIRDDELPLIDLTLLVKAGAVDIDEAQTGLDGLLNQTLIRGGTQNYSPSDLALMLDESAIQLSVSVREEESVIRLSMMKEDWNKGLDILEEILARPRFDPGVFDVVKQQTLITLKRQQDHAQMVAMREGEIWQFKNHPYGRDPLLGLKTIPSISRENLRDFLRRFFVPSNMVAAVTGDIEKDAAAKGLGKLFGALPKASAPERNIEDPQETPPVLALIHKPGQIQSQVNLRLPSVKRTHPDFWKMNLLMSIFGGNDSLMYTRLRDDLGLVYSAGFYQVYKWRAGFLSGYIGCKSDRTGESILETIQIMQELQKDVPDKELEQKRLDALNSFVFNVDTPAELAEVYARYQLRGEPLGTLERIQDAFINAGKEELKNLAVKLLDPEKLQIFIVADKETRVGKNGGAEWTLEEDLQALAEQFGIPYREIALR